MRAIDFPLRKTPRQPISQRKFEFWFIFASTLPLLSLNQNQESVLFDLIYENLKTTWSEDFPIHRNEFYSFLETSSYTMTPLMVFVIHSIGTGFNLYPCIELVQTMAYGYYYSQIARNIFQPLKPLVFVSPYTINGAIRFQMHSAIVLQLVLCLLLELEW